MNATDDDMRNKCSRAERGPGVLKLSSHQIWQIRSGLFSSFQVPGCKGPYCYVLYGWPALFVMVMYHNHMQLSEPLSPCMSEKCFLFTLSFFLHSIGPALFLCYWSEEIHARLTNISSCFFSECLQLLIQNVLYLEQRMIFTLNWYTCIKRCCAVTKISEG